MVRSGLLMERPKAEVEEALDGGRAEEEVEDAEEEVEEEEVEEEEEKPREVENEEEAGVVARVEEVERRWIGLGVEEPTAVKEPAEE